jgi:tRNA pseudouridine55 synthase
MTRIINKDSILTIKETYPNNVILIDKPVNWTSFDVVKKIKNIGRFKKVGHAGTLDPFAEGLLIIGTGEETKKLKIWSDADKSYQAEIEFGKQTNTYDVTGEITDSKQIDNIDWEQIKTILSGFLGMSKQLPPMFSAKKVDGIRLYKLARQGKEIKRKSQQIKIEKINMINHSDNKMDVDIHCSKGTYIRTIAHEIGIKSGYGAYLKSLKRDTIGDFSVNDALSIGQFESFWNNLN